MLEFILKFIELLVESLVELFSGDVPLGLIHLVTLLVKLSGFLAKFLKGLHKLSVLWHIVKFGLESDGGSLNILSGICELLSAGIEVSLSILPDFQAPSGSIVICFLEFSNIFNIFGNSV